MKPRRSHPTLILRSDNSGHRIALSTDANLAGQKWERQSWLLPLPGVPAKYHERLHTWAKRIRYFWPVWWLIPTNKTSGLKSRLIFGCGTGLLVAELRHTSAAYKNSTSTGSASPEHSQE